MNKADKIIKKLLDGMGVTATFHTKKKHVKIDCSYHGKTFLLIAPGTSSDHRAIKNFKAHACREIRRIDHENLDE